LYTHQTGHDSETSVITTVMIMSADMTTFMYLDLVLTIFKEEWGL